MASLSNENQFFFESEEGERQRNIVAAFIVHGFAWQDRAMIAARAVEQCQLNLDAQHCKPPHLAKMRTLLRYFVTLT